MVFVKFGARRHILNSFEKLYVELRERNSSKRCGRAARAAYFWWVPHCNARAVARGCRMARRKLLDYRRLAEI